MDCTDLYLKINHNLQENIQASLSSSHYTLFANANAFIDDYGLWQKWIAEKYGIEIFSLALSEYETALLFAVQSLYKQAFSSLRAYLEHTLFGIQLTTNLLQYLNWKQDAQDVYWSQIVDLDSGLFSSNYTSAFFSELCASSKLILDLAKRVYRECSQFTHGNYSAWEVIKYPPVYDEKAFVKFLDEAESIKYIIEYSFFIRFIKEIPKGKITDFESQIRESLGHLKEVTDYLSMINEDEKRQILFLEVKSYKTLKFLIIMSAQCTMKKYLSILKLQFPAFWKVVEG
ncbi:MAG: hypothetical protein U0M85_05060 [Gemmiger sp.]